MRKASAVLGGPTLACEGCLCSRQGVGKSYRLAGPPISNSPFVKDWLMAESLCTRLVVTVVPVETAVAGCVSGEKVTVRFRALMQTADQLLSLILTFLKDYRDLCLQFMERQRLVNEPSGCGSCGSQRFALRPGA